MVQPVNIRTGQPIEEHDALPHTIEYGGGNGGGNDMLERVKDLEKDVHQMKTDIAVMRSNYATKADVSDAKTSIILWVVGTVVLSQLIPAIPNILKVFFP